MCAPHLRETFDDDIKKFVSVKRRELTTPYPDTMTRPAFHRGSSTWKHVDPDFGERLQIAWDHGIADASDGTKAQVDVSQVDMSSWIALQKDFFRRVFAEDYKSLGRRMYWLNRGYLFAITVKNSPVPLLDKQNMDVLDQPQRRTWPPPGEDDQQHRERSKQCSEICDPLGENFTDDKKLRERCWNDTEDSLGCYDVWLTLEPELLYVLAKTPHLGGLTNNSGIALLEKLATMPKDATEIKDLQQRVASALGLSPEWGGGNFQTAHSHIVEIVVRPQDLFRPMESSPYPDQKMAMRSGKRIWNWSRHVKIQKNLRTHSRSLPAIGARPSSDSKSWVTCPFTGTGVTWNWIFGSVGCQEFILRPREKRRTRSKGAFVFEVWNFLDYLAKFAPAVTQSREIFERLSLPNLTPVQLYAEQR